MTEEQKIEEQKILEAFLSMPLKSSMRVFEAFINLNRFGTTYSINDNKRSFLYIPGKRKDRVLLVAHADTVWDREYEPESFRQEIRRPGCIILVNCILRTIGFEQQHLTDKIIGVWREYFPQFCGFSSYGEQKDRLNFNQTLLALVIEA